MFADNGRKHAVPWYFGSTSHPRLTIVHIELTSSQGAWGGVCFTSHEVLPRTIPWPLPSRWFEPNNGARAQVPCSAKVSRHPYEGSA